MATNWILVNKVTGKQYQPKRRGFTGYLYPSEHAANDARKAMPARWRTLYRAEEHTVFCGETHPATKKK